LLAEPNVRGVGCGLARGDGPCMTVCNRYDRWAKAGGGILERFPIAERVQQQLRGLQ